MIPLVIGATTPKNFQKIIVFEKTLFSLKYNIYPYSIINNWYFNCYETNEPEFKPQALTIKNQNKFCDSYLTYKAKKHSMDEFLKVQDLSGFINFCFTDPEFTCCVPKSYEKMNADGMVNFLNDLWKTLT